MSMQLEQRTYVRVPKNSTIHIAVKPKSGTGYNLNGRVDVGGDAVKTWSHNALKNKTVKYKFENSGGYFARISSHVTGSGKAEVDVSVKIIRSDGVQHSTTWSALLKGKGSNNDMSRAKIIIRVRS